ncbi:MAG: DUF552 domain-containing protein [Acidimicrobiia bacterium]|nr:DUF552 domain-containing protein [Acidimicrobiia bacterium]
MSSLFSKALVYLGLVDEDHPQGNAGNDYPGGGPAPVESPQTQGQVIGARSGVEGRRVDPPTAPRPQAVDGGTGQVRPILPVEAPTSIVVVEEFGDAKVLADRVRDRTPVVLDLRDTEPDLVRRVIDFSSGLIYALDGTMRRVGTGLVLVLPPRVSLSRDEKRRLASAGVYELDDVD